MDFLKTFASSGDSDKPAGSEGSNPELLASAKLVAEAAKATYNNESDKVDKQKVAGATADLLEAAEGYGKFDKQGVGKYLDQAEEYLHKYENSNNPTPPPAAAAPAPAAEEADKPAPPPAAEPEKKEPEKKEESGSGGYGDALKMAGSFFK